MISSSYSEVFWKSELNDLFEKDQKERKKYEDFLIQNGYIKGSFIENWNKLAKEYMNTRGMEYSPGDRIFGDQSTDIRIENLINTYGNIIISNPEYRYKLFTLVKNCDNNLNIQMNFLSKLKNNIHCRDIAKYLEERIKVNSNFQKIFHSA